MRDFVEHYVVLDHRGMGLCPFHEDHHPSFGAKATYWHCFAGCGGGGVIEFWRHYRAQVLGQSDDFTETIKDLARILGL